MKLLMVSYHFPPSKAARSLQLGKLCKQLLRTGVELDVVTVALQAIPGKDMDEDVGGWIEEGPIRIFRVPSPPRNWLDNMRSAIQGENFVGWRKNATRKAMELLRQSGASSYDAIVTFAMPLDSHLVGLNVKKHFPAVPWISHFSDPVANNPYLNNDRFVRHCMLARYEKNIFEYSNMVLSVSESLTEDLKKRYRGYAEKFNTLPHVYDPEQYPEVAPPGAGPLVIRYLGGFSRLRRPDILIEACRMAKADGADLARLKFEFIGTGIEEAAEALNAITPGLCVTHGYVGYRESLKLMRTANLLLLVDADVEFSPYYPSKLVDYFGSQRPVLAISPSHSYSSRLVSESGGKCYAHHECEQLSRYLADLCSFGRDHLPIVREETNNRYCVENIAKLFESQITLLTQVQ